MKSSGDSHSGAGASWAVRTGSRETALCVTEADALRTSDGLALLITSPLARARLRREPSLGAACGEATGERRGALIRTSAVSAISRMSWRSRVAEARSRLRARRSLTGRAHVETLGGVVRAPMQKFRCPCLPCFATPTPNHAMQLTATRLAINAHRSYSASTAGENALSVAAADLESR